MGRQVAVLDPSTLPVARRLRREAYLESRLAQSEVPEVTRLDLGLNRSRVDGLILDYSALTPTTGLDGGAYAGALGFDVLGGSLGLGLQSQSGTGRGPRTDLSWTGIWRENPYLAQLRLGDGVATGPAARNLRGVSLSNSPYVRPAVLGDVGFGGQLGPGWTVEAYRGGRLIGFDSVNALGQFSFDVPVQYGENPVDFVAYGPFGEVREFGQTYRMRTDGLPARRFEYGLSVGECRTGRCAATGNLDLRYGLSTRWTVRGGLDQFWRDSLGNLTHPYVGVLGALSNAFTMEAQAVADAVLHGVIRYEPSVNVSLQAEANRYARGVPDPILTPAGRLSQWTLTGFLRPFGGFAGTYFDASLDRIHGTGADITSGRLGASLQAAGLRFLPAVRLQQTSAPGGSSSTQTFYGVNAFLLPHPELGRVLGTVSARSAFEIEPGVGATSASAYLAVPITRGLRTETGLSWYRGSRGATLSFLLAAELPGVRSYTTVTGGGGQEALGSQYVQGSVIYNPTRRNLGFSGTSSLQRGGVTGRVFLDRNGNGRYDAGDSLLSGVRVVVGPTFSHSDSSGTYQVWDLLAFEPTPVTVDSTTLPSPLWVPAFASAAVEPSPNSYRRLDIPVLPGGVVEGRVLRPELGDSATVPGVSLVLRHHRSGEQRVLTTFTDGTFYAIGIRPGEWEITVDPKCQKLLGQRAEPVRFTMPADPDGATVSGLDVVLR